MDKALWQTIKGNLKAKNSGNKLLETWFDPVELLASERTQEGEYLKLGVPSGLHQYWISENFLDRIYSEISAVYGGPFKVDLIVTGEAPQETAPVDFQSESSSNEEGAPLLNYAAFDRWQQQLAS